MWAWLLFAHCSCWGQCKVFTLIAKLIADLLSRTVCQISCILLSYAFTQMRKDAYEWHIPLCIPTTKTSPSLASHWAASLTDILFVCKEISVSFLNMKFNFWQSFMDQICKMQCNSPFVPSFMPFSYAFTNPSRTIVHSMIIILLTDGDITVMPNVSLRVDNWT